MTQPSRVTVVGNGVGGYACAARLAELGVPVTLVGPGLPSDRPPLSKMALLRRRVPYLASARSLAAAGIAHLDGWARDPDVRGRELTFTPRSGADPAPIGFETLVWATGLRPASPPVPGIAAAHQNADPAGLERLLPRLARPGRRVIVLGAGLVGSETAATLSMRHRVTLLERSDRPLDRLHPALGHAAELILGRLGVTFVGRCVVERIEPEPRDAHVVHTATHGRLRADVVVAATGVQGTLPPALGDAAYLDTDEHLGVCGLEDVWACGDVASFPHPRFGRLTIPHWDNARAGGRHVAEAILGDRTPYTRDPYWFSDIGPLRIQEVGSAPAVCEWTERGDLHVGRGWDGRPACVVLLNAPQHLKHARRLLAAA
jgi:3-phenylpropionate/trans-cinnamate dioxygenase ferredoxin reductase component